MRYSCGILLLIAVLISCGDEYYGTSGGSQNSGPYPVETEPSISPDWNYIYYVSTDTATGLYSGIYRAAVGQPKREKIFAGFNLHSPTLGFDGNTVAYLDSGRIMYYSMSDMLNWSSDVPDSFGCVMYISDHILMGNRRDTIFLVTESQGSQPFITPGWDPTYVAKDTFVYFSGKESAYQIIKSNIYNIRPDTLFTMTTDAWPRWPSFERKSGWLTYCIPRYGRNLVYSAKGMSYLIDSTDYLKPLILRYNIIIFTGPDGRFYMSDFYGSKSVPFIYVKQ